MKKTIIKPKKKTIPKSILKKLEKIHKEVDQLNENDRVLIKLIKKEINAQLRKAS